MKWVIKILWTKVTKKSFQINGVNCWALTFGTQWSENTALLTLYNMQHFQALARIFQPPTHLLAKGLQINCLT